jgi:hypothetical protein
LKSPRSDYEEVLRPVKLPVGPPRVFLRIIRSFT